MFAVIKTGGKQYIVREGQELKIEKLEVEDGQTVTFDAMLVADEEGNDVKIGKPMVAGVKVSATVTGHGKSKKVSVIKYKAKVRYRRHRSHRQPFTKVQVNKIV